MLDSIGFPLHLKIWYVPKLVLSGFVKKKVTLVVFRGDGVVNGSGGGGDLGETLPSSLSFSGTMLGKRLLLG
ncbi:hypothetical protein RHGRI_037984 [Rhododendron griersonianum]|uniref:Uncharacterized protein n=1 Tax=Rhododendron griersonianum TaxID=479676 RepID=A0AAV6HTV9_9ERIC|nr:hypothetical protein RHGRI_037984 [Rhododendron griersonianum]